MMGGPYRELADRGGAAPPESMEEKVLRIPFDLWTPQCRWEMNGPHSFSVESVWIFKSSPGSVEINNAEAVSGSQRIHDLYNRLVKAWRAKMPQRDVFLSEIEQDQHRILDSLVGGS